MELIFDVIADLVLDLLGKVTRHSKKTRTQTIVDVLVASVFILVVDGLAIWSAVSYYRKGNVFLAVVFASIVVLSLLLIGFVIIRRIIRRRKAETEA